MLFSEGMARELTNEQLANYAGLLREAHGEHQVRLFAQIPEVLTEIAGEEAQIQRLETTEQHLEFELSVAGRLLSVEWAPSASPTVVQERIERLARRSKKRAIPVLVVPFMSDSGRAVCAEARMNWFDLSGNAFITAPGFRIIIEGRANRLKKAGRPANIFAPKSARVVRWLLSHPGVPFLQREIARNTGLGEGFVSSIAARLEEDLFVVREPSGHLRVRDPALLLAAWREAYQFSKHTIVKGHVAARSGDALARLVGDTLQGWKIEHAATGLAAAWEWTHFAAFRTATFFVLGGVPDRVRSELGFREEPKGSNLWLVIPNDAGVFAGSASPRGLRCVEPVQAYLDLKEHPERAAEAAEVLKREIVGEPHVE